MINIADVMHQPIDTLSKGYRRRVGVAQALLHDPAVIILDEPTDGLDPNQKHEMRGIIQSLRPDKSIIISTHCSKRSRRCAARAVIIAGGRLLADGTPAELAARSRFTQCRTVAVPAGADRELPRSWRQCRALPRSKLRATARARVVGIPGGRAIDYRPVADLVRTRGCARDRAAGRARPLDDVFRAITRPDAMPAETLRAAA